MSDCEVICDITGKMGEEAIDAMIDNANTDTKNAMLESSYSPTQIADEIENISTATELNNLLKNMNILVNNSKLNPLLKDNNLVIYYNGVDKKGNKYTQLRWTKTGKNYILKALQAYTTIVEPLLITNTKIQESTHPTYKGCYYLKVMDQYGRWWSLRGDSSIRERPSLDDIKKIEIEEVNKSILDTNLYYIQNDNIIDKIKRHEEISYVYTYDMNSDTFGGNFSEEPDIYAGYALVVTKDGLTYRHFKIFDNYQDVKKLALKTKKKGIVNLEFWTCLGKYEYDVDNSHKEFEEIDDYADHEYDMTDVYDNFATEEGKPTYFK